MTTTNDYTEHEATMIELRMGILCNDKDVSWMADKLQVTSRITEESKRMIVEIATYFHTIEKRRITIHERWPADWWQGVRERWLPAWWLKHHPIRHARLDIDEPLYGPVCPHLCVSKTDLQPVRYEVEAEGKHLKWIARREKCPHCDKILQ